MRMLAVLALLFVASCATNRVHIVAECDKIGLFARSVAVVRDIGVKENDFDSYVLGIQAQTFPVAYIRNIVYKETMQPVDTYTEFYNKCVNAGYNNMLVELKTEEQVLRREREHTQLLAKMQLEAQQKAAAESAAQSYINLRKQVAEEAKPEHVYGAPIQPPIVH